MTNSARTKLPAPLTADDLRAQAEPGRGGYHVFPPPYRQMSLTLEDAEFLYALVRLTKPALVLELGTGLGVSGRFIGEALLANGKGWLTTVEPNGELRKQARALLTDLPVTLTGSETTLLVIPDLVFIDSGWDRREADIAHWVGGDFAGLVVVHDAGREYAGLAGATGVVLPCVDGLWVGRAS